jgi:hypothetical protein
MLGDYSKHKDCGRLEHNIKCFILFFFYHLILQCPRGRCHIPPKVCLIFNRLHGTVSQKILLFNKKTFCSFHFSPHTLHTVQIFLLLLLSTVQQASLSQQTPSGSGHQNPVYINILLQI